MSSERNNFGELLAGADKCLKTTDFDNLHKALESTTLLLKNEEERNSITVGEWAAFSNLVAEVTELPGDTKMKILTEIYRILRNACAHNKRNQNYVRSVGLLEPLCSQLMEYLKETDILTKDEILVLIRCGLQFLYNVTAGNTQIQEALWTLLDFRTFRKLLEFPDKKIFILATGLLYNCSFTARSLEKLNTIEFIHLVDFLLDNIESENPSEWSLLTVEKTLQVDNFLENYTNLAPKSRIVLLDVIYEMLNRAEKQGENQCLIVESNILQLGKILESNISLVFQGRFTDELESSQMAFMKAQEIRQLLSTVCKASCFSSYIRILQTTTFVKTIIDALKSLHLLAKSESLATTSIFKPIEHISQLKKEDLESVECSPMYGFKKDLIRLIANLSHSSVTVQTWVRELDGIPLILDCCKLDARNPFIMQWCIFAIHNLLENNLENQALVANMEQNGVLVDSPLLKELGLELKDGKIVKRGKIA